MLVGLEYTSAVPVVVAMVTVGMIVSNGAGAPVRCEWFRLLRTWLTAHRCGPRIRWYREGLRP